MGSGKPTVDTGCPAGADRTHRGNRVRSVSENQGSLSHPFSADAFSRPRSDRQAHPAQKILLSQGRRKSGTGIQADLSGSAVNYADFCDLYPLHPVTMELLEEVRDRFSQARGIIDFTLTQLLGNAARGIAPFLDQPWGHLLTPDTIVDHFADLFEVQQEFLPIAQKLFPYFRSQIPVLFQNKAQQDLAWRLLKLMVLVHLSPRREMLNAGEAAEWLLFKVTSLDPERNR